MLDQMSFREKSAWISFLSLLAVFTPFFYYSYLTLTDQMGRREGATTAFTLLAAFVVLEIVLHAVIAIRAPKEARSPRDERERLIEMRATRLAFPVLVLGALLSAAVIHVTRSAWIMQQAVLFAIVVAELLKFGTEIVLFRRGA
ncbi:MAG: DUF2178 domain-containing protein [Vicinamibacterales bacterium]